LFKCTRLRWQLEPPSENTAKHLQANPLALDLAASLVLPVPGQTDHSLLARPVHLPPADVDDELLERVLAAQIQPLSQDIRADLAEGLADLDRDADANQLLESGHISHQIRVQVIRVERRPEESVLRRLEQRIQPRQLLDRLDEVGGLGLVVTPRWTEGLRVRGQQSERERKGRGGEDG
jgi:hypothetical protein